MTGRLRTLVLLVTLLLVVAATAGCFRRDRGGDADDERIEEGEADTITFTLLGVDAPEGVDEAAVNLTIDHIALYDDAKNEWVPLLTEAANTTMLFADGTGQAAFLVQVPLLPGTYQAIEIVATKARVITDSGASDAEIPSVACYAPVTLGAPADGSNIELELWLSGPDSLDRTDGGWRFQPALVGTVSGSDEGGAELVEPDCMPF